MMIVAEPRSLKRAAKGWYNRARLAYVRRWHAFTSDDLLAAVTRAGVGRGDSVMVHSSYDRFHGFTGKPIDVIRVLQKAVGPSGTILMPTLPFTGLALDYVARGEIFDVVRTPSRMGLLTELFRRLPDVARSAHPTHPVAAWGANAEAFVAGHHLAGTPCGAGSPFARLLEHDGKNLLLGTTVSSMAFCHAVEEILEPIMPFSPFTKETFTLTCRDRDGKLLVSRTRLFDPEHSRRRNPIKFTAIIKNRGLWKEARVGRLPVIVLRARDVLDTLRVMVEQGINCYDAPPRP